MQTQAIELCRLPSTCLKYEVKILHLIWILRKGFFPNTSIILLHLLKIIHYYSFLTNWKPLFSFYTKTFKSAVLIIVFWPAILYIV